MCSSDLLMEPPYVSTKFNYSHLSINITQSNQLHIIKESEAKFRLSGSSTRSVFPPANSNKAILEGLRNTNTTANRIKPIRAKADHITLTQPIPSNQKQNVSPNQAIIAAMKNSKASPLPADKISAKTYKRQTPQGLPESYKNKEGNCYIATAIYGWDSPETVALRYWRDHKLMTNALGRKVVKFYYALSPSFVTILKKKKCITFAVRMVLNWFVSRL